MKKYLVLLLLALCPTFALAAGTDVKFSAGALLDLQNQYFSDSLSTEVGQEFGILNAELNGSMKIGKGFLVKLRPTGHLDPANKSRLERSWADLPEGVAQFKGSLGESESLTVRAGMDTVTWGVTDGFNPVDVVSARRYNDPLHSEKLGALSAILKLDFGFALLEGIFIPQQRQSTLPGENSRWLPREIGGDVYTDGIIYHPPATPQYFYLNSREYDDALKNNIGARLSTHFLGIDAAAYFFNGSATVPATGLSLNGTITKVDPVTFQPLEIASGTRIGLRPIYHRLTMTGASAVFPLGDELLVRSEFAVTTDDQTNNASITKKNTEAALEVEHTFSWEKATLAAIGLVTYADPQENSGTATNTPALSRMFDRGVGLGLRWQPISEWTMEGLLAFDTKFGGHLVKLESTYAMTDAWKIYGSGEVFSGKTTTPIGVYRKNDRVIAGLKVSL